MPVSYVFASLVAQQVKNPPAVQVGDLGSIPGLRRSPGVGKGYPLQYSGLENFMGYIVQFSSVAQSCPTLCIPMNDSMPGLPVHHQLLEFTQTHVHQVGHLILCRPLLLLPTIPPNIRVFSNEPTLRMRWPKYWSFSFNISPSNKHPGLISFGTDWISLQSKGLSRISSNTTVQKHQFFGAQLSSQSNSHIHT